MNGVQILLIIGVGIAVSAIARRRGLEPPVYCCWPLSCCGWPGCSPCSGEDIDLRQAARHTVSAD